MPYRLPVESIPLLLHERGAPKQIPAFGEVIIGSTKVTHPFKTLRLWELDPAPVVATGDPGILPWAILMSLGREEARVGSRIVKTGNEEWISRFLTLGSLRSDREELERMLGGPKMGPVKAIHAGNSHLHKWS